MGFSVRLVPFQLCSPITEVWLGQGQGCWLPWSAPRLERAFPVFGAMTGTALRDFLYGPRAPGLVTRPAKYRAVWHRPEGDGRRLAALRAGGLENLPRPGAEPTPPPHCLTALAPFWLVGESLLREELLFPGRKGKFFSTLHTRQDFILQGHDFLLDPYRCTFDPESSGQCSRPHPSLLCVFNLGSLSAER